MAEQRVGRVSDLIIVVAASVLILAGLPWLLRVAIPPEATPEAVAVPAPGVPEAEAYVGSAACIDCHPGEHAYYTGSGHARTFRPVNERVLAERLDGRTAPDPERPGVSWRYVNRDGRFFVERTEGGRSERVPIDYAFGSGHHATTFLTLTDRDPDRPRALEHRLTHFTQDDSLGMTPGQGAHAGLSRDDPLGYELSPEETLKCFGCHATITSAEGPGRLDLDAMIPNVTCERCHGPGREHVAAARRGEPGPAMPFGHGSWTAEEQMALCGQCHRHPSKAPPGMIRPENVQLARFQPVGIMQSRCYTEAGGAFSCVSCHDPHARARPAAASYEAACLGCHGGPPAADPSPAAAPVGCVGCHMPRVDSGQGVMFTDHWIRVRPELGDLGPCTRPAG